jgi:hypothetical protein
MIQQTCKDLTDNKLQENFIIKEQRISGSGSINKCDSDIVIFRNTQWF